MGKTVQYTFPRTKFVNCRTIVFLIQKKTGFLSVFYIHLIADAVFHNLNLCIEGIPDETFKAFHSFLQAHFRIAALIDSANKHTILCKDFFQQP